MVNGSLVAGRAQRLTPFKRAALLAARFGIGVEVARHLCENDRNATGVSDSIARQNQLGLPHRPSAQG
jgi:hypothetical protein